MTKLAIVSLVNILASDPVFPHINRGSGTQNPVFFPTFWHMPARSRREAAQSTEIFSFLTV